MIKTRLISSELYKNKMRKIIVFIVILSAISIQAQSSQSKTSSTAISANFSPISIKTYQESAELKVVDYYNYLELLSSTTTSEALKTEVRNALFSLLKNQNIDVIDFTVEERKLIPLPELLEKINNKNYSFSVSESKNDNLLNASWDINYTLEIIQTNKKQSKKCVQKVYFNSSVKQFGTTKKDVWSIKLGEML